MFEDHVTPSVSLKSNWQKTRQLADVGVQTKPSKSRESECQVGDSYSDSVQTDSDWGRLLDTDDEYVGGANIDWAKLNTFLKSVEPMIARTLEKNRRQASLFNSYHSTINDFDSQVLLTMTLRQAGSPEGLQVNMVTWNASGTTVAVAYGYPIHEDWCSHQGWLCTWNVERRQIDSQKAHWSTQMASCCLCAAFHPSNPSLLAVGGFTGEILLWSLTEAEGQILYQSSGVGQQAVTYLRWIGADRLASSGANGRIVVWTIPSRGQQLHVEQCFQISVKNLPRALKGKVTATNREAAVTCLTFWSRDDERFVACTETGAVLYCNLRSKSSLSDHVTSESDVPVYDPVVLPLRSHTGPVGSAENCPFAGDRKFVTVGADGVLYLRDILKIDPILELDLNCGALSAVAWSPARPAVFAAASSAAGGKIAVVDLTLSAQKPSLWIDASSDGVGVTALAFNPQRSKVLASGDSQGQLKLWQLGESFSTIIGEEEKVLDQLGAAANLDQE